MTLDWITSVMHPVKLVVDEVVSTAGSLRFLCRRYKHEPSEGNRLHAVAEHAMSGPASSSAAASPAALDVKDGGGSGIMGGPSDLDALRELCAGAPTVLPYDSRRVSSLPDTSGREISRTEAAMTALYRQNAAVGRRAGDESVRERCHMQTYYTRTAIIGPQAAAREDEHDAIRAAGYSSSHLESDK